MSENKQLLDKHDKNVDPSRSGQLYGRSAGTSISADLARDEDGPTIRREPDVHPADRGMSPALGRALMGGLIGATLGILAGALANKRTAKGVNHAVKGVGDGAKTVVEGVNQATKGVGYAVKSVAEGVNYAVVGAVAEGLNSVAIDAVDTLKDTAEDAGRSVVDAVDTLKDTAEDAGRSVVGAVDTLKDTAEDVKPFDNRSFKLDEERLVADKKQVTTSEVGIGEQVETQTADISVPVEEEVLVVVQAIPVDAGTPLAPSEAIFIEGEFPRTEVDEETADTTTDHPWQ
jgi:stress response protein YsnF